MHKTPAGSFGLIAAILTVAVLANPYVVEKPRMADAAPSLDMSDVFFINQMGSVLNTGSFGDYLGIKSEITNDGNSKATFTYIVQIIDSEGYNVYLTWLEDLSIPPDDAISPTIFWLSDDGGFFEVQTYVWKSMEDPSPLTGGSSASIEITGDFASEYDSLISNQIEMAEAKITDAYGAWGDGDYELAREEALAAKAVLENAYKYYAKGEQYFWADQAIMLKTWIELSQNEYTLVLRSVKVLGESDALFNELDYVDTQEEAESILPKLELISRGIKENAEGWSSFAAILDFVGKSNPQFGIGEEEVKIYREFSDLDVELASALDDLVYSLQVDYASDYVPIDDKQIPVTIYDEETPVKITPALDEELVSEDLQQFFQTFDTNYDGGLDLGEAQEFYYWVENNIVYRYDDEFTIEPIVGYRVGDGRDGPDYRQMPDETIYEGAGDCEDTALLEQAFFNYFGIEAYVVGINVNAVDNIDHAATIVLMAGTVDEYVDILGDLVYYEMEDQYDARGTPITTGTYMLVDNAYSDAFGYLSGGLEPGQFIVGCIAPLDLTENEWYNMLATCDVTMN